MRLLLSVSALGMLMVGDPAHAASCSGWLSTCQSRGGGAACDAKFSQCLKTGRFTEGKKWGGKTHSGLERK